MNLIKGLIEPKNIIILIVAAIALYRFVYSDDEDKKLQLELPGNITVETN